MNDDREYWSGLAILAGAATVRMFDARLHTRWLTDAELARVHLNGVQEIGRRGIPQWR